MRHAKSSWADPSMTDHERPLNDRGRRDAPAIGGVLRARKVFPGLIWSSDSTRTRETAAGLLTKKPDSFETDCVYLDRFYHASANSVLTQCTSRGEPAIDALMLLGHNPGWEDLVYYFTGDPHRMPTAACAVLRRKDAAADWLSPEAWHLQDMIYPRDLA